MRAKTNQNMQFKQFACSGKSQAIITLQPNKRSIEQCQKKGLPTAALTLRLVRVELESGEIEVLVTNLIDEQVFPAKAFGYLYHLRWGVEENYKRLKQWIEIENFSGKSVLSVKQDFYAKVLTTNLASMLANEAQVQVDKVSENRKYDYQVNFAQAVSKMKNKVVELLMLSALYLQERLEELINYIACTIEPIRKGRSYSRPTSKMKNKIHYCNYKRAK